MQVLSVMRWRASTQGVVFLLKAIEKRLQGCRLMQIIRDTTVSLLVVWWQVVVVTAAAGFGIQARLAMGGLGTRSNIAGPLSSSLP